MKKTVTFADDAASGATALAEPEHNNTEPLVPELPGAVLNADGVFEPENEQFENFTVPQGTILQTDIHHLLAKGFDPKPFHFAWAYFDKVDDWHQRYFTVVRPNLHGKWFKDPAKAFNKQYSAITRGWGRGGQPELILMVRSAKADVAEQEAAKRASDENTPDSAEKMQAHLAGIAGQIGAENVRNETKYVTGQRWGAGSK